MTVDWSALGGSRSDRQLCQSSIDYAAAILVLLNSIVLMLELLHRKLRKKVGDGGLLTLYLHVLETTDNETMNENGTMAEKTAD